MTYLAEVSSTLFELSVADFCVSDGEYFLAHAMMAVMGFFGTDDDAIVGCFDGWVLPCGGGSAKGTYWSQHIMKPPLR